MKTKRFLSVLLALALCLGMLPGVALATEEENSASTTAVGLKLTADEDGIVEFSTTSNSGNSYAYTVYYDENTRPESTVYLHITGDDTVVFAEANVSYKVPNGPTLINSQLFNDSSVLVITHKAGDGGGCSAETTFTFDGQTITFSISFVPVDTTRIYDDSRVENTVDAGKAVAYTFVPTIYVNGAAKRLSAADFGTSYTFTCDESIGTLSWPAGNNELIVDTTNAVPGTTGEIKITDNSTKVEYTFTINVRAASAGEEETAGLLYRYMNWSNGQPYEDTNRSLIPVSELSVTYGGSEAVRFYYGTTTDNVPVTSVSVSEGNCIAVTECTTEDNSTTYWELEGTDLGPATLFFVTDGQTYSAEVQVILPGNGFYTSYTNLSKGTYLPDGFTYDGTNDTFYLVWNNSRSYIPANSEVSITYGNGNHSGLVSTELVETGETFNDTAAKRHAIKFTVANTVSDDFSFEVNFGLFNRDGGTETNNWKIRVIDSTPKLMYRYMSWDKGQPYENTAQSLRPASELNITYGNTETVKFYYGTAEKYVAASEVTAPENSCIKVTPGTTTDGNSTTYWELNGIDLGTSTLSVTGGDADSSFTATPSWMVDLPLIGIYSGTTASKDAYCSHVEYTGNDIVLYILPNSSDVTITSVTANGGPAGDHTTISNNVVTISSALSGSCNLSYKVLYTIGNSSYDVYIDFAFTGKNQGDEDGPGGNQGGGSNLAYTLISEKRPLTELDKVGFEVLDFMESGPVSFVYNGKTYYLCTMCPRPEEEGTYRMAYAGGGARGYEEGASFESEYCIGIWTANAEKDNYTLIDGEEKTALLAAFESWSVTAYHSPDHHVLKGYPATAYPEIYSWTDENGWPCGIMFKHYEDGLGSWHYKFTGTMKDGTTVTTHAKNGFHFIYNFYEYEATSVADANTKLQEWRSTDYSDENTYQIDLPAGDLEGIILVPADMVNVDINGSDSQNRTVLYGGIGGDGYARVRNIDFVGCGWWATNWPGNDVYGGEPNYGLYTAGGGEYIDCTFKNYYHALHCGPNERQMGRIIFGGTGTLFENNFIALYLNSTMNGGGDLQMTENTFRYNGCALWMENTGNRFTLNDYHLTRCKFYDNGWDVINLLGKCYFLPGQFFECDGKYGHGKFSSDRKAITHDGSSPRSSEPYASYAATDASEVGSGVYTFPVAKDDRFVEFDYTNKDAVIGNHNAAEWKIPESDLDGKTITVIQDDKGEDKVVWSFGEENK